jgi:hypothetical protein
MGPWLWFDSFDDGDEVGRWSRMARKEGYKLRTEAMAALGNEHMNGEKCQ